MVKNPKNSVWQLIEDLNNKKGITEIVVNNPQKVFVERGGQFIQLNINLVRSDLNHFAQDVAKLNKKKFDSTHPILDGHLPDGSRINIIAEPFAREAPAITIRKYLRFIKSFDKNPNIFGLTEDWVEFLKSCVSARLNIMISGGTGMGKTTFINLLLNELSPVERVVTIEDTIELSLKIPNVVRLEARHQIAGKEGSGLSVRDLVKNTLRMRPDRIIIGEVRGGELFDLLQAMNTGHEGSMSSIHANNPAECLSRMENLFLMSGYDLPYNVVRKQMSQGIDFIFQLGRDRQGAREISSIIEVTGMEGDQILLQTIVERDEEGVFTKTGITPKCRERLHRYGGLPLDFFNR